MGSIPFWEKIRSIYPADTDGLNGTAFRFRPAPQRENARVRITIWSDYVCPFCYLELPLLNQLRAEYGDALTVDWRAFEMRPVPVPTLDPAGPYLRSVWNQSVYPLARHRNLPLRLPPVQPRSRMALEAAEFARSRGRFDLLHPALFRAFFEEGWDIGDLSVLRTAGKTAGLDGGELEAALREGRHRVKVLEDEALATQIGVDCVPAILVGPAEQTLKGAQLISGAQPYERIRAAVERVRAIS